MTIPECQKLLPAYKAGGEPLPEGLIWYPSVVPCRRRVSPSEPPPPPIPHPAHRLLLTGEVPTKAQVDGLTAELHARSKLPAHAEALIRSLPKTMHPMSQLSIGLTACQTESKFAKVTP